MNPLFFQRATSVFVGIVGLLIFSKLAPEVSAGDFTEALATFESNAVLVRLEDGVRRVRLRQWNGETQTWKLGQMVHLRGNAGYLKLRVPDGANLDTIKVEVSFTDPFPYSFYTGKTSFEQYTEDDGFIARLPPSAAAVGSGFSGGIGDTDTTEVIESDIWKISGDRLYFFNQLRGLQLFDLSADDGPAKLGSLRLAGVGEQMYVLDDRFTILLAAWRTWSQSEIVLAEYDDASGLREAKRFPLPGVIIESRLIGRQLYVVSRFIESIFVQGPDTDATTEGTWTYRAGLDVSVIDFTDPANPVEKPGLQLAEQEAMRFYNAQVAATSTHLLVSTTSNSGSYNKSQVFVIDIAEQSKDPALAAQVSAAGRIANKFAMRLEDDTLTTVSQVNDWSNDRNETVVETFELDVSLSDGYRKLDEVALGIGEQLFATRFHGGRLYVVTFERVDPFWVVDVSDPYALQILGELEVPGFSRYLEPWGDKVIAIGVEDRMVTASLFQVADPTNPELLSRVQLGEGFSWSEANYDEKAVNFDPDRGLLLVPYQSWDDGVAQQNVQLIDVTDAALVKRGVIEHDFSPRRAGNWRDDIVSVSGRELLVVDASDRDHPVALSRTAIAWNIDRLFEAGGYLVQIEEAHQTYGLLQNTVRVTTTGDPDNVLTELSLGDSPIVGAAQRDGLLHVLSARAEFITAARADGVEVSRIERTLISSIIDISSLPELELLGETRKLVDPFDVRYYVGNMKALWLPGGELAWASLRPGPNWGILATIDDFAPDRIFLPTQAEAHVIDVTDKSAPQFVSSTIISEENSWSRSPGFLITESQIGFTYEENRSVAGQYVHGYFLRVVDLTDPTNPLVSDKISIAGSLESVVRDGSRSTLITKSQRSAENETPVDQWWRDSYLQASVYDGAGTFLVDEVKIANGIFLPAAYHGGTIFHELASESGVPQLLGHAWNATTGSFDVSPVIVLEQWQSQLAIRDDLLLGLEYTNTLSAIDIVQPLAPGEPQAFPTSSNFGARLNDALVDRTAGAWLTAGAFGAEYIDFDGAFASSEASFASALGNYTVGAAAESEWRELPIAEMLIVDAEATDFFGSLSNAEWNFVPMSEPTTPSIDAGETMTFVVATDAPPDTTFQWQFNGGAIPGASQAVYTIPSVQRFHAGEYSLVMTNSGGTLTTPAAVLHVSAPAPSNARLLNLSTRGLSLTGSNVLIPGFVIAGSGTKQLLIRAIGPTLGMDPFELSGVLENPRVVLRRWNRTRQIYEDVVSNDDWAINNNADEITTTSALLYAFRIKDDREAVLLVDLPAGQYTVVADGVAGATGLALVEIYDADEAAVDAKLINLSNRGFVGVGAEVMISGLVVSSEGPRTFLIRVVGPKLGDFDVPGTLADPKLALYRHEQNGTETQLFTNDNWSDNLDATHTAEVAAQVGAFALEAGSKDAAVVVTLKPGIYTVIGSGADGSSTGVALVEVYQAP